MLRWWPGIVILLLFALGPRLAAQAPPDLPTCDLAVKQAELDAHGLPDFTGCSLDQAVVRLKRKDFGVILQVDPAASGYPRGTITNQSNDKRIVTLSYSDGSRYPPLPPTPDLVRFSIEAPSKVAEGSDFKLTIHRSRIDQQAHVLTLDYRPADLLDQAPVSYTFSGEDLTATIPLHAAQGTPGDGDKPLLIALTDAGEDGALGKPSRLHITITDQRPAQSYTVATSGEVRHDAPITFIVTRTDMTDPVHPTYELLEDGNTLDDRKEVAFGDGAATWQLPVDPGRYGHCTASVDFVLHTAQGDKPVSAQFADAVPADCYPPPSRWPWAVGGIFLISAIGYGLHKWPWFKPTIVARWAIAWPLIPPFALGERALRWPGASAAVRIEPGDTHLPDPLPVENDDHG